MNFYTSARPLFLSLKPYLEPREVRAKLEGGFWGAGTALFDQFQPWGHW